MPRTQQSYSPLDYGFKWVDDWYEFDQADATKRARAARDAEMKRLRAEGHVVKPFTLSGQVVKRGGIGSGHPEVDFVVSVYYFNVIS